MPQKTILLPKPRGLCADVIRAVDIVLVALEQLGSPVYVRKEIVHNRFVVDDLAARGAVFVDSLDEVPDGAVAIFSVHGVSPEVHREAESRKLHIIDAERADTILVVGAQNSSNSNRLVEVVQSAGTTAHLIASPHNVRSEWLDRCLVVGVSAGASSSEILVQQVVHDLKGRGFTRAEEVELIDEDVHFPLLAGVDRFERVTSDVYLAS